MQFITCLDSTPTFIKIFDPSVAPALLYYAYIPIILISIFLGIYILIKDNFSLRSLYFFLIAVSFSLWVLNIIFQWVIVYANMSMFSWQITAIIEVFIPISILYFYYYFIYGKEPSQYLRWLTYFSVIGTSFLITTKYNMSSFNVSQCQANVGPLLYILAFFEILIAILLFFDSYKLSRNKTILDNKKKQAIIISFSSAIFLIIFSLSNLLGFITESYQINLFGPIGALTFIGFMFFMIVRYGLFNIKLIATEALVIVISLLIGAQLFITSPTSITYDEIITVFTLLAFLIAGFYLTKSVKREIESKEALKIANTRQAETASLITHQIRGVFTNTKAGLSEIIEGSFGSIPIEIGAVLNRMYKSQIEGVKEVEAFLQAQKVENGSIQYDFNTFDIKDVVEEISSQEKTRAEEKNLQYEVQINNGDYVINGDKIFLTQVIANIIDNAIRYTEKGSIKINLSRKESSILFSVSDSGVGINDEDKPKIFTKYGHGTDSRKINPASSGLGLYIVKGIVDGHRGKIWYETEVGKGTTFFIELPITQIKY